MEKRKNLFFWESTNIFEAKQCMLNQDLRFRSYINQMDNTDQAETPVVTLLLYDIKWVAFSII
jgi:hypothetical protein